MRTTPDSFCLSCGWTGPNRIGACENCGSDQLAATAGGGLVGLPAGHQPCDRCGALDRPLRFRGSVRLVSMILVTHEQRPAGYYCEECALRRAALYLAITGVVGWWAITALFYRAPRGTYYNWRAVWTHPGKPVSWGAYDAMDVAAAIRAKRDESEPSAAGAEATT